jgi:hypothetical protein
MWAFAKTQLLSVDKISLRQRFAEPVNAAEAVSFHGAPAGRFREFDHPD